MNPVLISLGKDNSFGEDFYREPKSLNYDFDEFTAQLFYDEYYLTSKGGKSNSVSKNFTVKGASDLKIALSDALAYLALLSQEPTDFGIEIAKIK